MLKRKMNFFESKIISSLDIKIETKRGEKNIGCVLLFFVFLFSFLLSFDLKTSQFGKGLIQIFADCLVFLLLGEEFVLQSVDLLLQFRNGSLSLRCTVFCLFQTRCQIPDRFLVAFFSLRCFLFAYFQRFHVVADDLQFFFQFNYFSFSSLETGFSSFKIHFCNSQLSSCLFC